jgi:hypothetical protein
MDDEADARKLYASLMQEQDPKARAPPSTFFFFLVREHQRRPRSTPQQPDARTSLSREELRREIATRVGSFSLPTGVCELAEMEHSGTGAALGGLGRCARVSTSPILGERAEPDAARGAVELIQEPTESQGRTSSPGTSAASPAAGKPPLTVPRTSGGGRWCEREWGFADSQTDPDAGSDARSDMAFAGRRIIDDGAYHSSDTLQSQRGALRDDARCTMDRTM